MPVQCTTAVEPLDFAVIAEGLPDIVWRHRWDDLAARFGLPHTRYYMQKLDQAGEGPPARLYGNRVAYLKPDLIQWLQARSNRQR